ncbi:hypothetical protein VNKP15269_C52900 (plasmid) [Klebsiella pneumoniae]|nr:hypothetical protein VNKP15269_C52900 [Klebsiella pneumoniae]
MPQITPVSRGNTNGDETPDCGQADNPHTGETQGGNNRETKEEPITPTQGKHLI